LWAQDRILRLGGQFEAVVPGGMSVVSLVA
jgi:hypothetical protein